MKKVFRKSQKRNVLGKRIFGLDMYLYGMPYDGAGGTIGADNPDLVELMLLAVERHPEIHVVTYLNDDRMVNRYVEKDAYFYILYTGNADPEIEFEGWSEDDFTEEQHRNTKAFLEEFSKTPWNTTQIAAVNWLVNDIKAKNAKDREKK